MLTGLHLRLNFARALAVVLFPAVLLVPHRSYAQSASAAETCLAVNQNLSLGAKLPRTAAIFKSRKLLKIVAIGSSSTVGLWMNDPAKTYQGVMQTELMRLIPGAQMDIVNSGRNGDTIPGNIARFESDVFAHHPDLVIWQMGGNDFTWMESGDSLEQKIIGGIQMLKANGAEIILMDQQYTPMILATQYAKMQAAIASAARQERVAYLPRFEMMHKAVDAGVPITSLAAWDGLHMSGEGYDCTGRVLARAIVAALK
ncbi:MAG: SGNH/GDSL hydrolase family protein [Xanthobacteraceae bacterium]|nr:SGNH/GDSL hydrolase family protein [Xanthobacteraceae bacterium]